MEVHLNLDLQAKLEGRSVETGRSASELIADAVADYFDELAQLP